MKFTTITAGKNKLILVKLPNGKSAWFKNGKLMPAVGTRTNVKP